MRKPKPSSLPEPDWGRHRKGGLLHAWEPSGAAGRRTLCGVIDIDYAERPSRRGRRCPGCVKRAADPRADIGRLLASSWPRGVTFKAIRKASCTKNHDRIVAALKAMERDRLVYSTEAGHYELWSARRVLVEAHGRHYGMVTF